MRYDVGRFRRPMRRSTEGQLMSLISLGDGSTLTLDFTTGVLDPRLTFTRASNATFINSSGLVEFAAANEFRNTGWVTSTTPTGWNVTFGTGTTTWNNDGTLTMNTGGSSTRPCINANSFTVSQGIPYTFGYRVISVSGSPSIQFVISSTVAGETFAINGTTVSASTVVQSGDVVSCTFTPTTTSAIPRMGPGVAVGMTNTAMTITQPQMNPGVTLQAYRANSSTAAANNDSARFDHDPTTLAPRGLLIEGTASTLNQWGEDYTNAYWTKVGSSVSATSVAGPDNVSTATRRIVESATTAQHGIRRGIATTAGQAHTVSVFVKPGSYDSFGFELFWSASYNAKAEVTSISGNTATVTSASGVNATLTRTVLAASGWYRYALTFTHPLAVGAATPDFNVLVKQTAAYAGNGTNYMDVYGFMLEAGSGASSYIPTGASTVQRLADFCTMPTSSFITGPLYPQTLFAECIPANPSAAFPDIVRLFDRTAGGTFSYGTELYYYGSSTMTVQRKTNASTNSDRPLASGLAYNSRHKLAVAVDSSAFLGSYDGLTGSGATTAPPALASQVTHMGIGCTGDASAASVMFGTIRQIKFFPFAMAQSQLNTLTTL